MDCTANHSGMPAPEEAQVQRALNSLSQEVDLEGSASYSGALVRRRVIQSARDLLRFVLLYSLSNYSLRMVGLWGTVMGWGSLCKSGVRKRLRQCQGWIGMLVVSLLVAGKLSWPERGGAQYRLRLVDASNVCQPGSHQSDWRLHLSFDLTRLCIDEVKLTTGRVGESRTHLQFAAHEICLADRAYGVVRSLGVLLGAGAFFVIRIGWQNLPVQDRDGHPVALADWLRVLSPDPAATPAQRQVWVVTPQGRFPIRLRARAIPPDKAAQQRKRLRQEAHSKKRQLDERSLLAAGFVLVVSNLPESWSAGNLLALYRFRWQIELVFKRLKSILTFDHLRASDPVLAQVYLVSKILTALLLQRAQWRLALADTWAGSQPHAQRPVSAWRLTQLLHEAFRTAVCGCLTLELIQHHWPQLKRYLTDDPRRRSSQFAAHPDPLTVASLF